MQPGCEAPGQAFSLTSQSRQALNPMQLPKGGQTYLDGRAAQYITARVPAPQVHSRRRQVGAMLSGELWFNRPVAGQRAVAAAHWSVCRRSSTPAARLSVCHSSRIVSPCQQPVLRLPTQLGRAAVSSGWPAMKTLLMPIAQTLHFSDTYHAQPIIHRKSRCGRCCSIKHAERQSA